MRSLLASRSWSTIMILPSSGNSISWGYRPFMRSQTFHEVTDLSWGHRPSWGHWPLRALTSSPKGDLETFQYLVWAKPLHLRTGFWGSEEILSFFPEPVLLEIETQPLLSSTHNRAFRQSSELVASDKRRSTLEPADISALKHIQA